MDKKYCVYLLASRKNGTLYLGITNNLVKRIYKHKQELVDGFSKKYKVKNLVYYEIFENVKDAIHREKCLKKWKRDWKINLINEHNPNWLDLYEQIV